MNPEYKHYFKGFEIGDITDKGKIDNLFFLQFDSNSGGWKTYEPNGKGLIMATIEGKDYIIGDLKKV
jgi:hypothetical protein